MIRDYTIIDNVFSNPEEIRERLLGLEYYSNESVSLPGMKYRNDEKKPSGFWRGYRSINLEQEYTDFAKHVIDPLIIKVFTGITVNYSCSAFGHIIPAFINDTVVEDERWHVDRAAFAGIVYLSKSPVEDSGTFVKTKDGIIKIENIYNRLAFYRANLLHGTGTCFGNSLETSRLTLTFFVNKIALSSSTVLEPLYY